jgi:hypothetical protein
MPLDRDCRQTLRCLGRRDTRRVCRELGTREDDIIAIGSRRERLPVTSETRVHHVALAIDAVRVTVDHYSGSKRAE